MGRWFRPAGFVIAGLFLLLPFIAVSCDAPGGFGRAAPGGTTTYTGIDLITGDSPEVTPPDKVREGVDERLDPQPMALVAAVLMLVGIVVAAAVQEPLVRRAANTIAAGLAAIFLVINQIWVQSLLQDRVRAQLTQQLPEGKQISDYVHNQAGFLLCLTALVVLIMANGAAWWRTAMRT